MYRLTVRSTKEITSKALCELLESQFWVNIRKYNCGRQAILVGEYCDGACCKHLASLSDRLLTRLTGAIIIAAWATVKVYHSIWHFDKLAGCESAPWLTINIVKTSK